VTPPPLVKNCFGGEGKKKRPSRCIFHDTQRRVELPTKTALPKKQKLRPPKNNNEKKQETTTTQEEEESRKDEDMPMSIL